MAFGSITANTKTYELRSPSVYVLNTLAFGDPTNEFRLRGGSKSKDNTLNAGVIRYLQKDVTVAGATVRKSCTVSLSITMPESGITASEIDACISDISEFLTASTLSRLLQGET